VKFVILTGLLLVAGLSAAPTASATEAVPTGHDQATREFLEQPARSMEQLQQQIDLQLELAPGGRQTAPNEVSYDDGRFVVTYALPGTHVQAGPDCPSGWFCFYDNWL
jgi:hypothetical protein